MKNEKRLFAKRMLSLLLAAVMLASPAALGVKADVLSSAFTASAASAVSLSKCTVTVAASVAYTGKEVKPKVTVKNGKTTLKSGRHYTVKYSANKNFGTGKVTVTAVKGSGYTGSKTASFKIIPAKPTVNAKSTSSSVTLSWNKVAGATKYDVYSYNASNKKYTKLKTVTTLKYDITGLPAAKSYSYAVKAYAAANGKTYAGSMSAVKTVSTAPGKPATPTASAKSDTQISLSWKKVSGASGYNIYSYDTSKKTYKLLTSTTATSATVKNLKAGTSYKLCVSAYRTASKVKYEGAKSAQVSATTKPAKVGSLKASTTDSTVTLSWGKITGATGYTVYSYDASSKKYTKLASVKTTSYTVSGLKASTKYSYAVCAYITSGNTTLTGAKSVVVLASTKAKPEPATESLKKVQKIIRSGTFNIVYKIKMKDFAGGEDMGLDEIGLDVENTELTMNTYVKGNDVRVDTNIIFDFTFIYLESKKKGYMITDGLPPILPKSYDEMTGKDAKMDGFLDSKETIKMFAPEIAKGETVREGTKKVGSKTYKTATFKTVDGATATYYFYNNEFKILEKKNKDGSTEKYEISSLSASVPDKIFDLPKNFPKGYEKM